MQLTCSAKSMSRYDDGGDGQVIISDLSRSKHVFVCPACEMMDLLACVYAYDDRWALADVCTSCVCRHSLLRMVWDM